jgi:hypothetical protein
VTRAGLIGGVAALAALAVLTLGTAQASAMRTCDGRIPTIVGTPGADSVTGTYQDDVIRTGRGEDRIQGLSGNDVVCAGPGNDLVDTADGNDSVRAGAGDDRVTLGFGTDSVKGQGGTDRASGGDGVDSCVTESHDHCEADLSITIAGPYPVNGGDSSVYVGTATVRDLSGSSALSPQVTAQFPKEAEFVASSSDPGCREAPIDVITCPVDPLGPAGTAVIHAGYRFPDCPPASGAAYEFSASVADEATVDPQIANNTSSLPEPVNPAPGCH